MSPDRNDHYPRATPTIQFSRASIIRTHHGEYRALISCIFPCTFGQSDSWATILFLIRFSRRLQFGIMRIHITASFLRTHLPDLSIVADGLLESKCLDFLSRNKDTLVLRRLRSCKNMNVPLCSDWVVFSVAPKWVLPKRESVSLSFLFLWLLF